MTDEKAPEVYAAIQRVSAAMAKEGISKNRTNQQQNYRFRGIDDVLNSLAPVLAAEGLVIVPRVLSRDQTERQTRGGGVLFAVVVAVEFDIISVKDGSKHVSRVIAEAMDSADKATNKAMSAAYKYMTLLTFCIPVEGEEDADETTHDVAPSQPVNLVQPKPAAVPPPPAAAPASVVAAPAAVPAGGNGKEKCPICKATGSHRPNCPNAGPVNAKPVAPAPAPKPATAAPTAPTSPTVPDGTTFITATNSRYGPATMKNGKSVPSWGPLYVITFSQKVKATDGTMVIDASTFEEPLAKLAEAARDLWEEQKFDQAAVNVVVEPGKKKGSFRLTAITPAAAPAPDTP